MDGLEMRPAPWMAAFQLVCDVEGLRLYLTTAIGDHYVRWSSRTAATLARPPSENGQQDVRQTPEAM